ncbi:response regulator transcription factor [Rhodoferax saidenbachensis]|uniref:DNA-binding NarL/FixJ family response regulator n=1 Tax=Rhodoferax saidenbachensis TaxID=1484693 RepID=A0ABU1ZTC0_9BURK|nr:response regulator transcription factor [Rhodoferax saidenbachensis]MDR7308812.1 DNA-binding NarL/FixJ family response regulator [Rhodoferax saidenbachensis]
MWRVLVVEDDPLMREFFEASVSKCTELELAASFGSALAAKAWLDQNAKSLHVLLTDLGLPDGSGLDVIRYARALNPDCEPLVISMFGDEDNVLASIEAGALGYIHKDSTPDDIADTILEMRAGGSPISPMVARRILAKHDKGGRSPAALAPATPAAPPALLSPREQEVLELISQGHTYAEIAELHQLSTHTVQTHIKRLYSKLSVHTRGEAVFEATRMGLL